MEKRDLDGELPSYSLHRVQDTGGSRWSRKVLVLVWTGILFGLFYLRGCESHEPTASAASGDIDGVSRRVQRSWAMLSPWAAKGVYVPPPEGCVIDQVNLLQRHGARQPSGDDGDKYEAAFIKLLKVKDAIPRKSPLAFVKDYEYMLEHDELLPFGAFQSTQHGSRDFLRYEALVRADVPFVRASGAQRVVDSATNWTKGFSDTSGGAVSPKLAVVIPEEQNTTLTDEMCVNAGEGVAEKHQWRRVFAPRIAARLNRWAPGAGLDAADVANLMSICPLETQLHRRASAFCGLFTKHEWAAFEYYGDVEKFYRTGYGNPLGPVQGVGYVNELVARLTNTSVQDRTSVNHTLDADPATFPLGRAFYADFTHENLMVAVFAALGLFKAGNPLDPLAPDPKREWVASELVPFSARLVTERLQCAAGAHVRMFLNEAPVALDCAAGGTVCGLNAWVAGQTYARSGGAGDWEKCFD